MRCTGWPKRRRRHLLGCFPALSSSPCHSLSSSHRCRPSAPAFPCASSGSQWWGRVLGMSFLSVVILLLVVVIPSLVVVIPSLVVVVPLFVPSLAVILLFVLVCCSSHRWSSS